MKLLCIVTNPYMGGLQIMTLRLFKQLSPDIKSHFLLSSWSDGAFAKGLQTLGIPFTNSWMGMFSRKLDKKNLKMSFECLSKLPRLYRDFRRVFRNFKPDLIYFGAYHEIILLLPVLMTRKVPVVYHVHNVLPTGKFYRASFKRWQKVIDHYVAVSQSVADSIQTLGIESQKISVLYNGIDVSQFTPANKRSSRFVEQFGWPEEAIIVGMTGQMFEGKGHLDFLQAAKLIHEECPLARFVIGGEEQEPYCGKLRWAIDELGLKQKVAFSGWENQMSRFYTALDLFVVPSSQENEGLPLVTVEAMASGLPIVVTRSGGAGEAVEEGHTGLTIERENLPQLAEALRSLIGSPELRQSMGASGRRRVEETFELAHQAEQFERIIEKVSHIRVKSL